MNQRILGRTGLKVSELALGGLFVSSHGSGYEQAESAIRRALQLGVNYIDTAPGYANSEEVLGKAFAALQSDSLLTEMETPIILSSKLGGRPTPFEPQNADQLRVSVDESLRLLGREQIDILMIHEPDRPGQYDWWTDHDNFNGPVLEVIDELKQAGKIKYSGLGGTTVYEMTRLIESGKFDVVLTAFNYSLLWREAERTFLPAAKAQNMGIVVGSPLQQGALARRFDEEVNNGAHWLSAPRRAQYKALYKLCDEIEMPLPELAIRFIISNPDISTVLMGARSPEEVESNVESVGKGALASEILERVNEIAATVPFRPYEEPFSMQFGRKYYGPGTA